MSFLKVVPPQDQAGCPAGLVRPSCKALGCEIPAAQNHQGLCTPHHDAYLMRAYELTKTIGRGTHA